MQADEFVDIQGIEPDFLHHPLQKLTYFAQEVLNGFHFVLDMSQAIPQ